MLQIIILPHFGSNLICNSNFANSKVFLKSPPYFDIFVTNFCICHVDTERAQDDEDDDDDDENEDQDFELG